MSLFHKEKELPDYLVEVEEPKVTETSDMHYTYNQYINWYETRYCNCKILRRIFQKAHTEVSTMTDAELATSLRNGWTYDMLTVYLLKRTLTHFIDDAKSKTDKQAIYNLNKVLMSRGTKIRLDTKKQAKQEDADMKKRLGIE